MFWHPVYASGFVVVPYMIEGVACSSMVDDETIVMLILTAAVRTSIASWAFWWTSSVLRRENKTQELLIHF